jgi:hypothetical protein
VVTINLCVTLLMDEWTEDQSAFMLTALEGELGVRLLRLIVTLELVPCSFVAAASTAPAVRRLLQLMPPSPTQAPPGNSSTNSPPGNSTAAPPPSPVNATTPPSPDANATMAPPPNGTSTQLPPPPGEPGMPPPSASTPTPLPPPLARSYALRVEIVTASAEAVESVQQLFIAAEQNGSVAAGLAATLFEQTEDGPMVLLAVDGVSNVTVVIPPANATAAPAPVALRSARESLLALLALLWLLIPACAVCYCAARWRARQQHGIDFCVECELLLPEDDADAKSSWVQAVVIRAAACQAPGHLRLPRALRRRITVAMGTAMRRSAQATCVQLAHFYVSWPANEPPVLRMAGRVFFRHGSASAADDDAAVVRADAFRRALHDVHATQRQSPLSTALTEALHGDELSRGVRVACLGPPGMHQVCTTGDVRSSVSATNAFCNPQVAPRALADALEAQQPRSLLSGEEKPARVQSILEVAAPRKQRLEALDEATPASALPAAAKDSSARTKLMALLSRKQSTAVPVRLPETPIGVSERYPLPQKADRNALVTAIVTLVAARPATPVAAVATHDVVGAQPEITVVVSLPEAEVVDARADAALARGLPDMPAEAAVHVPTTVPDMHTEAASLPASQPEAAPDERDVELGLALGATEAGARLVAADVDPEPADTGLRSGARHDIEARDDVGGRSRSVRHSAHAGDDRARSSGRGRGRGRAGGRGSRVRSKSAPPEALPHWRH